MNAMPRLAIIEASRIDVFPTFGGRALPATGRRFRGSVGAAGVNPPAYRSKSSGL